MAATDARVRPIKGAAYRVTFPIFDADGDLVTAAGALDSEVDQDGGGFTDVTAEAVEIGTSGMYRLDLTATEMNGDTVSVIVKSTLGKTTPIVMYPELRGGVVVAATASTVDLATSEPANDDIFNDSMVAIIGGTGRGQARLITDYTNANRRCTVNPDWDTNPDTTSIYEIYPGTKFDVGAINGNVVSAVGLEFFGESILTGATQIGSTASTVVLSPGESSNFELFNGARIAISSGTAAGQTRLITAYNGTSKTATIVPDWDTIPGTGDNYSIQPQAAADLHSIGSSVQSATDLKNFADAGYDPGTNQIEGCKLTDLVTLTTTTTTATNVTTLSGGAIAVGSFANNSITALAIAANAIGSSELATDAIGAAQMATGAIAALTFATDAITAAALATDAVDEIRDAILSDSTPFAGANIDAAITTRATPAQVGAEIDSKNLQRALVTGTATGGSTTTLIDAVNLTQADTNYWKGCWLVITDGTLIGQARKISLFDIGTDTLTVDRPFTVAVVGHTYEIWSADFPDEFADLSLDTSGRVSLQVGDIDATKFSADAITSGVLATSATEEIADTLLDRTNAIEVGLTLRQAQRVNAAALAGVLSGAGTATATIRNAVQDSKTRITMTTDAVGNRSAPVFDLT